MDDRPTRRGALAATGAAVAALAGCVSGDGSDGSNGNGGASNGTNSAGGGGTDRPAWQTTSFEDARTGETLTVAEFDEPVVLHTFATWCSVCHSQQQSLDTLKKRRGDDVTLVDLTIDENDDPDEVAAHAESNGFDWRFGVAPAEMTSSLVDDIGDRVVFAPQSPVVVVCPDGTTEALGKGVSADTVASTIDNNCT
jgi:cytochrome oxidase Cu insertion factor (SCO1/SenC/PrrC family)